MPDTPSTDSNSRRPILIEVCVDSVESAVAAQEGGADRIELCDNLLEGGTTPSIGMIDVVRAQVKIPIHVLIRPRGGDFCYSDLEYAVMQRDIVTIGAQGVDGFVLGILTPEGDVDLVRTRALVEIARPRHITFHRAFDMSRNPQEALEALIGLGIERVLTSGQEPSALEGLAMINTLIQQARNRIIIMPGGGVARSLQQIVTASDVQEVHMSVNKQVESAMTYRNPRVSMGRTPGAPEYTRLSTDASKVAALRQSVDKLER